MTTTPKLKLLKLTFEKLTADPAFLASHLQRAAALRGQNISGLCRHLHCTEENYYQLGLARVPAGADAHQRIEAIAAFAQVDPHHLLDLLGAVLPELRPLPTTLEAALFAPLLRTQQAPLREVLRILRQTETRLWRGLQQLPAPALKAAALVLLSLSLLSAGRSEVDPKALAHEGPAIEDSLAQLAIEDNTAVVYKFQLIS